MVVDDAGLECTLLSAYTKASTPYKNKKKVRV